MIENGVNSFPSASSSLIFVLSFSGMSFSVGIRVRYID